MNKIQFASILQFYIDVILFDHSANGFLKMYRPTLCNFVYYSILLKLLFIFIQFHIDSWVFAAINSFPKNNFASLWPRGKYFSIRVDTLKISGS